MTEDGGTPILNKDAYCPSCERFIGPAAACPYCGTDSARRPAFGQLRYAALLLSIVGLALLYFAATHRELPRIRVADITPAMNFAYVRVTGRVARDAYVSRKGGDVSYLSFPLDDGTGEIRVAAYAAVARRLVESGAVPARGRTVTVSGSLSAGADGKVRLRMESAGQLTAAEPEPRGGREAGE